MRELTIAGQRIADDAPTWVIAEIGNAHQGSLEVAHGLIEMVARAGAQAVKFQKKTIPYLYTPAMLCQPYQHEHSFGETYGEHKAALELDEDELRACFGEARQVGLVAFATAFDEHAIDALMRLDVPCFKVHSGGLKDTPLLRALSNTEKPLIVSTGGATQDDLDRAFDVLCVRPSPFAFLHCTAAYPVRDWAELNLSAILTMRERYQDTVIGWSGHDSGIAMALMAQTLGARIIEKHVTLNRAMKGTDHAFSLEGQGLTKLVRDLRRGDVAFGDGVKRAYASETGPLAKMSRVIVAAADLLPGHRLRSEDLDLRIAGEGLPPYLFEDLIGFPLVVGIKQDEPLRFGHLQGMVQA